MGENFGENGLEKFQFLMDNSLLSLCYYQEHACALPGSNLFGQVQKKCNVMLSNIIRAMTLCKSTNGEDYWLHPLFEGGTS